MFKKAKKTKNENAHISQNETASEGTLENEQISLDVTENGTDTLEEHTISDAPEEEMNPVPAETIDAATVSEEPAEMIDAATVSDGSSETIDAANVSEEPSETNDATNMTETPTGETSEKTPKKKKKKIKAAKSKKKHRKKNPKNSIRQKNVLELN